MIQKKRDWRRVFGVAVSATLLTAGLVACSGNSGASDDAIVMTIWGGETDKAVYTERLKLAQEKYPDIKVKLQQISDDYDRKVQTMVAGGTPPDIMMVAENVNVFSSKNQLEDLTPYLEKADVSATDRWSQGSIDTYSTDGKLWAAPDRSGAMVLYYNKDLFDAAGVAYPDGSWGWDEFRDTAQELTVRDGDTTTQYGYAAGDWWAWYMTFMYQNGGQVLDDSGTPVVNSPENREALEFYNNMVMEDHSAPSPRDYANLGVESPDPLFAQGKLAMVATGFWNIASLLETDLNWDIAPLWHGEHEATPAFGSGLAITKSSKHKDAAAQIIEFLSSAEGQKPIADSGLDVPANLETAASPAFTNPSWLKAPVNLAAFSESAAFVYTPPLIPQFNELTKAFTDKLGAVWNGEETVEAGLAAVQSELERILK